MEESKQKQDQDHQTLMLDEKVENWSEHVENLLDSGDMDGAISFLELLISHFNGGSSISTGNLQLAPAMSDLADLYSSKGYSIKSDELRSRALSIRARINEESSTPIVSANLSVAGPKTAVPLKEKDTEESVISTTSNKDEENSEDDWEAVADKVETDINFLSLKPKAKTEIAESGYSGQEGKDKSSPSEKKTKRKGRGSFLYNKSMLYSDTQGEFEEANGPKLDPLSSGEGDSEAKYGTRHALVLYDLPTSTRTTELEKIFEAFDDCGVAIRWINDTSALAVFRSPSLADSGKNCIPSRYKFRFLHDDDEILAQLKNRDLEPPYPRPKTSARTAQRLIAQSMGLRISSPDSGVREHKQQEKERKNRIVTRQALRDEAWGSD